MYGTVGVASGTTAIHFQGPDLGLIFNTDPGRTGSVWPYGYPRWSDLDPALLTPPYRADGLGVGFAGPSFGDPLSDMSSAGGSLIASAMIGLAVIGTLGYLLGRTAGMKAA